MKKQRFVDIDCVKGLTIILVVLGHIVTRNYPIGDEWFGYVKGGIYTFHMPLFIFLSGWIFNFTYLKIDGIKDTINYILKRAYRLLVPFFLMAFIIILGKYLLGRFLYVDNPINDLGLSIINLFWNTNKSCVGFIWYVYVVFIYIILTILGLKVFRFKNNIFYLIFIALIMKAFRFPGYFYLNLIGAYYIYFLLGYVAFQNKEKYYEIISKYANLFFVTTFLLIIFYFGAGQFVDLSRMRMIIAICAIIGIHGIIKNYYTNSKFLFWISKYTFSIYLFNLPFIGLSKGILLKVLPWDGVNFFIFLPIMLFCGLLGPIILYKYILARIPIINKLMI